MRASRLPWLCLIALAARPSPARAWEGLCRTTDDRRAAASHVTTDRLDRLERTLCEAVHPDARPHRCEEGLGYARGVQLGEHTWITREAMRAAGLPEGLASSDFLFAAPAGSGLPSGHFTAGLPVALAPDVASLEPAGTSSLRAWVERRVSIAEVSEFADGSHSFSGYLLGNEHCLPAHAPRATRRDLDACHTFGARMGTVNATHWPPLHRELYVRYHDLALEVADRCRRMHDAVERARGHRLRDDLLERVRACEREALAFQSYAAHFGEDAWATGHMFVRWGGPQFAPDVEGQVRAFVASALTGFLHGTRSLLDRDDLANAPGTFEDGVLALTVRWRGLDGADHAGGGDLYLRPCTGLGLRPDGAVSTGPAFRDQLGAMLGCAAKGFEEVYTRTAQASGARVVRDDPRVRGHLPTDSTSLACFTASLTNETMFSSYAAARAGSDIEAGHLIERADERRDAGRPPRRMPPDGVGDVTTPDFFERMVISIMIDGFALTDQDLLTQANLRLGLDRLTGAQRREVEALHTRLPALRRELSREAGRVALHLARRRRADPTGTDVATMTGPSVALREVFGVASTLAWEGGLRGVAFLEGPAATWAAPPGATCARDDACADGQLCDRTAEARADGTFAGRCVRHEHAILRAFRVAETPHWCAATTARDLAPLHRVCRDAGAPDRDRACRPCVEAVLPHLRNPTAPGDPRSVCEVLDPGTRLAIGARYTDVASARREARRICEGPPPAAVDGGAPPVTDDGRCRDPSDIFCGENPWPGLGIGENE